VIHDAPARWFVYGLGVETDLALTGLAAAGVDPLGRLSVQPAVFSPPEASAQSDLQGQLCGRRLTLHAGDRLVVRLDGVAQFRLDPGERRVGYALAADVDRDVLRDCVVDYVLPLHLSLDGRVRFLHASAVDVGPGAIAFTAPSGTGKSTLAAHFLERGHALVADDKLGVWPHHDAVLAMPAMPAYRLEVGGVETSVPARRFAAAPRPLLALYVLESVPSEARARVTRLSGVAAVHELSRAFQPHLPCAFEPRLGGSAGMRGRFHWWASLAARVPVFRLEAPRALSRLGEVHDAVMAATPAASVPSC
jgi:hypothetical protein